VVGGDRAVGREDVADLDVVVLQRALGERAARVQRLEAGEGQTVDGLQAEQALLAGLELGRRADGQVLGDGLEVGDGGGAGTWPPWPR
jgi:hypothetical protein